MLWIPISKMACSPNSRMRSSISLRALSTISSMRAGWIRPSWINFSKAMRAISRRIGSKPDNTTASGVSSMIKSIPVSVSNVRMLRPSRPMMRPFMSSFGKFTTVTVDSATTSEAERWIAWAISILACLSAVSLASVSLSLISFARSWASSALVSVRIRSRAWLLVNSATCSKVFCCSAMMAAILASRSSSCCCLAFRLASRSDRLCSLRSSVSSR